MLTLTDDLRKFQKYACENQLDNIITVQDNFSNGTVTIRDLVKQNHTIIHEFKRMKGVFINYTKINQKMYLMYTLSYDKIVDHQLTFGSSVLKMGNMANYFQSTIEGTLQKMKLIYDDTVGENKRAEEALLKAVTEVRDELNRKVDVGVFNMAMRAMNGSSEEEVGAFEEARMAGEGAERKGSTVGEGKAKEGNSRQQGMGMTEVIIPKPQQKGKKISEQQLNSIKNEVLQQLNTINTSFQQKFIQVYTKIQQNRKSAVTLNEQSYRALCAKITECENKGFLETVKVRESVDSVKEYFQAKTHQKVWDGHKNIIMEEVKGKIAQVVERIKTLERGCEDMNSKLSQSIKNAQMEFNDKLVTLTKSSTESHQDLSKKLMKCHNSLNTRIDQVSHSLKSFKEHTDKTFAETNHTITTNRQRNVTQILQLREAIDKLVLTLQGSVLKLVIKRFQENINELVNDMKDLRSMEKETSKRVSIAFENINDIKQVTGRKANFTDIVNLFQKKASKQQLSLLKQMMSTNQMNPRKDQTLVPHSNRRVGDSCGLRLKSSTVRTSKRLSPDRSFETSVTLGLSSDKGKNQAKFLSKRFYFRPQTARNSVLS